MTARLYSLKNVIISTLHVILLGHLSDGVAVGYIISPIISEGDKSNINFSIQYLERYKKLNGALTTSVALSLASCG